MKSGITVATIAIVTAIMIATTVWLQGLRTRGLRADTLTKPSAELSSTAPSERIVRSGIDDSRVREEQIGNPRLPTRPKLDIADDQSASHSSERPEVVAPRPVPPPTTKSTTRDSIPPPGALAGKVEDPAPPVILSDYQTWTVIGATASTVDSDRVRFSGGIAIADRSGNWITADQGDVVLSNGSIAGLTLAGDASVRARPDTSMADFRKTLELLNSGETREISVRIAK